ncbi:2-keto-4-methylthiobutyrate aminotransferase [Rubrobacter taiwanensis]|jgi:branched-chain amino acid aminotransferase|uniref:2-keto-4-methylthiobutyrate aminotransferase n=1 Tax=Rubrobacter taiwanensis TaxID=185139 RepID=A0A4R1BDP5_9ACTN|nr:aminotransferase class IV [Rubrobacter taiwanensis]TCJ15246.1 2-keto-4-methylthiobutyrate aminotransferase [Rubrobacter taiwanensis]
MSGRFVWTNGELAAAGARIDPRDRGFSLGDGLFETLRVRDGEILRLKSHLSRLREGAKTIGLPIPWSDEELAGALEATLAANGLSSAAARLTVSRGVPERRGLLPDAGASPTLVVTADPFDGYPARFYERGMAAVTSGMPRNERSPLANVKSLSYLENVLARREAAGADESLLLNTRGDLACASAANIFLVFGEKLVTPDLPSGALPGTVRAAVLKFGLAVEERPVRPEELEHAREAFLTSALLGAAPLVAVDGRPIGSGEPGPISRELSAVL